MQIDLTGKTALVTGSTEGIGYAIGRQLARAGADVVINGRSDEKTAKAGERLKDEGAKGTVTAIAADLATAEGCAALVAKLPRVDILINNAGIFQPSDFFDTSDEVWDLHWQVNVMSAIRLSRAYLPSMEKANWGRVIFIASESGFNIPVEMIHYGVSKTARHRRRSRTCQAYGRHRRYCKLGFARSHSLGRCRSDACRRAGENGEVN